jgi:hypothetical protein
MQAIIDRHDARIAERRQAATESQVNAIATKNLNASGLGDYVAAGLSAVGITPERVSAALGVKDCGCKKRQARLNELGRRLGIG